MYFVVMLAVVGAMTYLNWGLVHSTPRAVGMWLSPTVSRVMGICLLFFGMFIGVFSAYALHHVPGVIESFIQIFAGVWFLLTATLGQRGTHEDDQMLRRLFIMLGLLELTMLSIACVDDRHLLAMLSLALVTGGFWVTTNFVSYLDRGR